MSNTAPPVLDKNAEAFRKEVAAGLQANVDWKPADPAADQASAALIGVFSRFCEVLVERLNRAPEKNFLAFLDLLGASLLPPQPARVPVTFTLNAGSAVDALVPAGTQVAAPPAPGTNDPVIFETERELSVVAVNLQALFSADGAGDLLADHGELLTNPSDEGISVFSSDQVNEHVLYIGHELLGVPRLREVRLDVAAEVVDASGAREFNYRQLIWERWDGSEWRRALSQNLSNPPLQFSAADGMQPSAPQTIGGITNSWMRCRWPFPIASDTEATLPIWHRINVGAQVVGELLRPDALFTNGQPVDGMRPFYPFGLQPGLGDALYIGSGEAFSLPGAKVFLSLPVLNPTGMSAGGSGVPSVQTYDNLNLWYEASNGTGWFQLGSSGPEEESSDVFTDGTRAFTVNISRGSRLVSITLPDGKDPSRVLRPTEINGVTSCWIRVRIVAGNYGRDAHYIDDPDHAGQLKFVAATFAPPLLESLSIGYSAVIPPTPADVVSHNNLQFENLRPALARGQPVMPFRALPDQPPSLYMGFTIPADRTAFPNRAISLYHGVKGAVFGEVVPLAPRNSIEKVTASENGVRVDHRFRLTNMGNESATYELRVVGGLWADSLDPHGVTVPAGVAADVTVTVTVPPASQIPAGKVSDATVLSATSGVHTYSARLETRIGGATSPPRSLRWEYWNGTSWSKLSVLDDTGELTRSGIVEFLAPGDLMAAGFFGVNAYWIRAVLFDPDGGRPPVLRRVLPNTVMASQTRTVRDEHLGSSDATGHQKFRTTRAPVLASPQLEVREAAPLTGAELAALQAMHGAIDVTRPDPKAAGAVWVRWLEVSDLYASGPQDRHYVLDHATGEVRFGDGVQGRIPPRGSGNIRMARYQIGGGRAGNVPAGTIVQMKTTVPFVATVSNPEAAMGGVETESTAALLDRAPRLLRHSNRAVAANDYEDLARLASPEVTRAKCVPLRRLQIDPLGNEPIPGVVSVIVVPDSKDPKPQPSLELLTRVEKYLRANQAATAMIHAVGPQYVRVDVTVEAAVEHPEGTTVVEEAIRVALDAFLHPLTGGRSGAGWDFGREPHSSDLYAIVGGIPGVDHVRQLSLTQSEEIPGARAAGRFLIYSGVHRIDLRFIGAQ